MLCPLFIEISALIKYSFLPMNHMDQVVRNISLRGPLSSAGFCWLTVIFSKCNILEFQRNKTESIGAYV